MNKFLYFRVLAICSLILLVGCQNQGEIIGVTSPSTTQTVMNDLIDEPVPSFFEPQEEIELIYKNIEESAGDFPVSINQYRAKKILNSSIFVKSTITLDELSDFVIYTKSEEDTQLYIGMPVGVDGVGSEATNEVYEVGTAGELEYLDTLEITKSSLFGDFHIQVFSTCGANCVNNLWFFFDYAVPIINFQLNTHAQEIDLDQDGVPEIFASESTLGGNKRIYKRFGEQIKYVDLSTLFGENLSYAVDFDKVSYQFIIETADQTFAYQYKRLEDVFVLVNDMESSQAPLFIGGIFDGTEQVTLEVNDTVIEASWFQDPLSEYGLYIPKSIETVKFEDGYEFRHKKSGSLINIIDKDRSNLPYLRKESDLENFSEYLGTEYYGDDRSIRYDYYTYIHDEDHHAVVSVRYLTRDIETVRPLLLAIIANIQIAPKVTN